jgi:ribosome-associated toxin RatA of RatAB toxin-antitoxin module
MKLVIWLLGIALTTTTLVATPAIAQSNGAGVNQESASLGRNLKDGEILLRGSKGKYIGYTIVRGNIQTLWSVLTDYDNFEKYMPNVVESQLLESRGNQKVFEQVQNFQILFFSRRTKVKTIVTEEYPKLIKFKVLEGEVKSLEGSWKIEQLAPDKFLVIHQVTVEPDSKLGVNSSLFYSIYEDAMEKTLRAISKETARR